ncbi:MAG: aldehyde dehydrogenase family protein [bacterium]
MAEHARAFEPAMAEAITREMGKPIAESRGEAGSVAAKIHTTIAQLKHELPDAAPGAPGEQRFHPLGVVAVIGPFNFPVHLVNTHIIPALLTGNVVVVKPSEITPLSGQIYAEVFAAAGLPPGVFNLIHGLGATGAALAAHPGVDGVIFTGSYATGRRIREATFDQPWKKVSLELGGRNPAVVLDDAHLEQTVREILLGALLSTGQRCTATSRVIATRGIAEKLLDRLARAFKAAKPGDPLDRDTLIGPLATQAARDRFLALLADARAQGARPVVESRALPGGAFVTPSLYQVQGDEAFLREELFGPHLDFEIAEDDEDAFARAARNPYGLSASLFTARDALRDAFYDRVRAGVINYNRSTNGASGLLPFGGIGMSGNWSPAGSLAPRLCTYPVAIMAEPHGRLTPHAALDDLLETIR